MQAIRAGLASRTSIETEGTSDTLPIFAPNYNVAVVANLSLVLAGYAVCIVAAARHPGPVRWKILRGLGSIAVLFAAGLAARLIFAAWALVRLSE